MTLIVELFNKLAITTWDVIGNAFEHRISYGEDAITSTNLLALKNASFPNLAIADTRPEESTKGCDFEFWIGDYRNGWFRYAIQAKKISVRSGRYDSLNHSVGSTPQIDILENYARANRAIPLYCLFNYTPSAFITKSPCPKFVNIKEYGCSVTPSSIARLSIATRGARNFNWFHSRGETLPWSCLVRCPQLYSHWPESIIGAKYENVVHEKLPQILSVLLESPEQSIDLIDTNLFSREVEYRPRWVGVVNTEGENKG